MTFDSLKKLSFLRFKALNLGFLVLLGLMIPLSIFGVFLFEDDFESYEIAKLGGQGNWTCAYNEMWVNTADSQSGVKSVRRETSFRSECKNIGYSPLQIGEISFWIKTPDCNISGSTAFWLLRADSQSPLYFAPRLYNGNCLVSFVGGVETYYSYEDLDYFQDWTKIQLAWKWEEGASYGRFQIKENEWSDWFLLTLSVEAGITGFQLNISDYVINNLYFDTIAGEIIPPPIAGYEPIIEPETPIDCTWNNIGNWTNFDLKGKLSIPDQNPNLYNKFLIRLYNRMAMEKGLSFLDIEFLEFGEKKAGEVFNWDIQNLEIAEYEDGYFLCYWLEGYNLETLKPFRWQECGWEKCGKETIIHIVPEYPVGFIPVEWIEMIYEDCSELSGIDKILCEFVNWIKSIFAPSKEAIDSLNNDIRQLTTKFPFVYIFPLFDFAKDIKSGVDEEANLSISVFGNTENLNLDIFSKSKEIGGLTMTFSTIFKTFFVLIIIFGFGKWLLSFAGRIL